MANKEKGKLYTTCFGNHYLSQGLYALKTMPLLLVNPPVSY